MQLSVPVHDRVEVSAQDRGGNVVVLKVEFIRADGDLTQALSFGLKSDAAVRLRHQLGIALHEMSMRRIFERGESR